MLFEDTTCFPCLTVSQAARVGNLDEVKRLVHEAHPCDVADNRGWRAIHEAAHGDYIDCLRYLLEQGVTDANWQSFEGITPLHLACEQGSVRAVKVLLDQGADPNLHDHVDEYPILIAVKANNLEIVSLLMGQGARTNVQLYCGTSPLHQAASEGFVDMVTLLLDSGARLDIREDYDITPIFSAAQYGQTECLELLLQEAVKSGAESLIDSPADDGATALYLASQEGHISCVRLLLKHGANANRGPAQPKALPLHAALQFNHIQCVKELLPHTDKDCLSGCDRSPFYFSTIHKDTLCTAELLESGMSPSYRHKAGDDDEEFRPRNLRFFMSSVKYSRRMSPLVQATMNRCPLEHCKVLLNAGACVDARTPFEVPPLLAALEYKNLNLARMLIGRGARVNIYHPRMMSNMTILVLMAPAQWSALRLMLMCGAEAESVFCPRAVHQTAALPPPTPQGHQTAALPPPTPQGPVHRTAALPPPTPQGPVLDEDAMSGDERDDLEAEIVQHRFLPIVLYGSTQLLWRLLYFVGCVYVDPQLEGYIESKEKWKAISAIVESPRPLTHLCRLKIRGQMTPRRLLDEKTIRELPLPDPVIDFLLYKELS